MRFILISWISNKKLHLFDCIISITLLNRDQKQYKKYKTVH